MHCTVNVQWELCSCLKEQGRDIVLVLGTGALGHSSAKQFGHTCYNLSSLHTIEIPHAASVQDSYEHLLISMVDTWILNFLIASETTKQGVRGALHILKRLCSVPSCG